MSSAEYLDELIGRSVLSGDSGDVGSASSSSSDAMCAVTHRGPARTGRSELEADGVRRFDACADRPSDHDPHRIH